MRRIKDLFPKFAFLLSLLALGFAYGFLSARYRLPPEPLIAAAKEGWDALKVKANPESPWYYIRTRATRNAVVHDPDAVQPGLTMLAGLEKEGRLFIRIVDRDGRIVADWRVDWFDLWPDATHLDEDVVPKSAPGTFVHGVVLMEDGGVVFNYEALGMVRLDACGKVLWRLPYRTHHSIFRDDAGNLWAPGQKTHHERNPAWPLYNPPFEEYTIVKVSPEGRLLSETSVFDLLRDNGLQGLLYMAVAKFRMKPEMEGDSLHLNEVELFPENMKPGFFKPGDIMISLRNINAVLVLEPVAMKVKYLSIGHWIRQHDPDFVDGNTITVFDNNDVGERDQGTASRIVEERVPGGTTRVVFSGTPARPFFTDIMGSHQWLANGNLFLVEARQGRILELDPAGKLVWEYENIIGEGLTGAISDAQRLPPSVTAEWLASLRAGHPGATSRPAGAPVAGAGPGKAADTHL